MRNRFKDRAWYPYTVTACIAVVFYVALTNISTIWTGAATFVGYFRPVILGLILAYMMNPLARFVSKKLLGRIGSEKLKWTFSVLLSVIVMILFLAFMLGTLVPQLAGSVMTLVNNMDTYAVSLQAFIDSIGLSDHIDISQYIGSSGSIGSSIVSFLRSNVDNILNASATVGKKLAGWAIAFILAVYMLMAKDTLKSGSIRLLAAAMPQKRFKKVTSFLARCDRILVQYIVYSLLDSVIVGVINALFMRCFSMQYIGLVSLVVAVTNLVPTFGPIIGGAIGGFILLLVKPFHALAFILFSVVLQFFDGYILKPKMFGNTLGVSGLLIIIAVIVFGNMFGIVGILLAIPAAAILYFIYEEELLPALEKKRANAEAIAK